MMTIQERLGEVEQAAVDLIASTAPWLTPIPTAYLVGRATVEYLRWPAAIAVVAAAIIEALGLAAVSTTMTLREYNASKRKADPAAPFALAVLLVGVYLAVAVGLTVALDIAPSLARFAPAVFPLLSLAGVTVLALRADHRRRLAAVAQGRAERQAERQANRQAGRQAERQAKVSGSGEFDANLDRLQAGRRAAVDTRLDRLLTFYLDNPAAGVSEAARAVGVSRQTVYDYQAQLQAAGRLRKNGNGWEVCNG